MVSTSSSERVAQLRAFDETKLGVKGLVDAGVTTIPSIFIHPSNDPPSSKPCTFTTISIPTIDLSRAKTDSNERKETVKKGYYTRDYSNKNVVYNSNFDLYSSNAANWRDTLTCFMAPNPPKPEELPSTCRVILAEYTNEVMKLGNTLFELLSEALGLQASHLNEIGCSEGLQVLMHYYPSCPQPDLTMGTPEHADHDFLTVLLRDQIGGLQVLQQGQWFDAPATPEALLINTGDILQLITNDRFKSVKHRVLLEKNEEPRISVACFFTTGYQGQTSSRVYGPIKELVSSSNPAKYRETTVHDYANYVKDNGLDISNLQHYRI